MTEDQWIELGKQNKISGRVNHYAYNKKLHHYISIGEDKLPALVFVTDIFSIKDHINLLKEEELLSRFSIYATAVGKMGNRSKPLSIEQQSDIIYPLIARIHRVHQPVIIIASKYTAAAACHLIAAHRELVQALVLINPVLKIQLPKKNFFRRFLEKIFPVKKRTNRNKYKKEMLFNSQLQNISDIWSKIQIPLVYLQSIHRSSDARSEAAYINKLFINAPEIDFEFYKNHLVENVDVLIKNKILQLDKTLEIV